MNSILRVLNVCTPALVLGAALAGFCVMSAARAETLEKRGEYLVQIMDCTGCHTYGALAGKPDPARQLAGSDIGFELPGLGVFYPPNLTSDAETGLGKWAKADIIKALRQGVRPDGRELAPIMPWRSYAVLTDKDVEAVATYLKSLPPFKFMRPGPFGSGDEATSPYLTVAVPE